MNRNLEREKEDLICAGINNIKHIPETEKDREQMVGCLHTKYGEITVTKGHSYYWMVSCKIPLALADKLYEHPEGRRSVRVAGHCMAPAPIEWADYFNAEGKPMARKAEWDKLSEESKTTIFADLKDKYDWVEDPSKTGIPFILNYHIDSQAGLLLFSQMVQS